MFGYFRNYLSNGHQICCEDSSSKGLYDHCQSDDRDLHLRSRMRHVHSTLVCLLRATSMLCTWRRSDTNWCAQVWGDGVAQLVEHRTRYPKTTGSNPGPVRSTRKNCESFLSQKCCADSLLVCPTPPCVYARL